MNEHAVTSQPLTPVPADNPGRTSKVARPDTDQSLPHIGLVGDTYTILLSGDDTDGRYCLIDMHIPPGGGPPPHRHDFEESFIVREGEIEATFRGAKSVVRAGETLHIPAQRAARLHQRHPGNRAPAVHLRTGRSGGVLRPGRRAGGDPHDAPAEAGRGRPSGVRAEGPATGSQIPDGTAEALILPPLPRVLLVLGAT